MSAWIVIFGAAVRPDGSPSGTLERRVRAAYAFGRNLPDTRYLVTGGRALKTTLPEWQVMQRLLLSCGVAASAIVPEKDGLDTLGQIRICAIMLRQYAPDAEIWISTSRYHQARCRWLLRLFGIPTRAVPALPDRPHMSLAVLAYHWAREAVAIPYDLGLALIEKARPPR